MGLRHTRRLSILSRKLQEQVMIVVDNTYTSMQKSQYSSGTTNHAEHNDNPKYWDLLLGDLKNADRWNNKNALDFACGKGRNVSNMLGLCNWNRVDGIDISSANIDFCKQTYSNQKSNWYLNNGIDVSVLLSDEYDFVMSTIALQHIPVYDIRRNIITDILRVMRSGGLFSFQLGYGKDLSDVNNRPRSSYYDNAYTASGTNSEHDVRVQNPQDVVDDLTNIGFINVSYEIHESFSDSGHPQWIYIKAYKKS